MAHDAKRVAEYMLWLGRDTAVTPMRLLKLVYLSHGWMLGLYDRPLIRESAEAWPYGPVVPSVYHAYKKFGGNTITSVPPTEPSGFSGEERSVMSQVWNAYRQFSALQLSALTHQPNTPWDVTRRLCGTGSPIPNDLIREHYRALAARQ